MTTQAAPQSTAGLPVRVWAATLPSRLHPERNEDAYWSAPNGVCHAMIDGMGGSRRFVPGMGEIGGEHAAAVIVRVLAERLANVPPRISRPEARALLEEVVAEAGARVFGEVNDEGAIPPAQVPEGKAPLDVMAAACATIVVLAEEGSCAVISQNGDTRAYLYSPSQGEFYVITEDDDAISHDVEAATLEYERGRTISQALDDFDGRDISILPGDALPYFARRNLVEEQLGDSAPPPLPAISVIQLGSGDALLLTSDGVHDNLSSSEITEFLRAVDPATALVQAADARSGESPLPNPEDPGAPFNYRAHPDDASAMLIRLG